MRASLAIRSAIGVFVAVASVVASAAEERDVAKQPAPVNGAPGPEYAGNLRMFQGIPGIERAASGRLWAVWYGGGKGEDKHNYIMLVSSADDGKTWSDLNLVIDPDGDGPCRAFDPTLWHDPQGRLWVFWAQQHKSKQTWAITTEDSGSEKPKWSKPRLIHEGIMLNKPTVTSNGTWLLPLAMWAKEGSSAVVASTDQGATFQLLGKANIKDPKQRNCDEHMLVERKDNSLWMLVRVAYGIGESFSSDQGKTWSDVEPSPIVSTVSRFFIRRLNSGKLLLVRHDAPVEGKKMMPRSHLKAFLSDDDGKTWSGGLLLDERKGISYPDAVQSPDGAVYVIYDYNRHKDKEILMARFTEEDVLAGKSVGDGVRFRVLVNKAAGKIKGAVGDKKAGGAAKK